MPKYQIGFQSVEIEAENLVSAAHRASLVVPVVNELYMRNPDSLQPASFASEAAIASSPTSAEAAQDRRALDVSASDQNDAPDGEAKTFEVGRQYKSDTGKWIGTVVNDYGDGQFSVELRNTQSGHTESREFSITDNGNLRSDTGNIVLRAKNIVG